MKQSSILCVPLFLFLYSVRTCAENCPPEWYQPHGITIAPRTLTPLDALNIAFNNRPSQIEYDYTIKSGKNAQWAELSGYLPHIDVQARMGKVNRAILLPEKQIFIEAKQLLLTFAGPIDRYRIVRQETRAAQARKLFDQDSIRFDTESSLLDLWDVQQKFKAISSLYRSSKILFDKDRHQNQLGLLDTNVWLQSVSQFAGSTAEVEQYTNERGVVLANVERSLGLPIPPDINVNEHFMERFTDNSITEAQKYDPYYYFQLALENRKELIILDEQILREEYQSKFYAKSYIPEVYFFSQVNYFNFKPLKRLTTTQTGSGKFVDWRVGIEFDWKFDGLGNTFNSEASKAAQLALQANRLDTAEQIKKEVYTTYNNTQSSFKAYTAQKAKFRQASNELVLRKKQYDIGEISQVEMNEAITTWEQARYDLKKLKKQTAQNYRELLSKSGYPDNLS